MAKPWAVVCCALLVGVVVPSAVHADTGGECAGEWGACLEMPCCAGTECYRHTDNEFYSQCLGPNSVPPGFVIDARSGSPATTNPAPTTPPPPGTSAIAMFLQRYASTTSPQPALQPAPTPTPMPTPVPDPMPSPVVEATEEMPEPTPIPTPQPVPTPVPVVEETLGEMPAPAPTPTPVPTAPTPAAPIQTPGPVGDPCAGTGKWDLASWDTVDALGKAFLFYKAQQSGVLEEGHPVEWRGSSYLNDGADIGVDLVGGYVDAGDHLKLMMPYTIALTNMAWGASDGKQLIDAGGNAALVNDVLDHMADFLMRCHLGPGEFVAQIGEKGADHGACYRAQLDTFTPRTVFSISADRPGSDLLFGAAAALAAYSEARSGSEMATRAASEAKILFEEGKAQEGSMYSDNLPELRATYESVQPHQYGFLAAAWLFRTTGEAVYQTEAERLQTLTDFPNYNCFLHANSCYDYSWAHVFFGASAIMNHETGGTDARYTTVLDDFVRAHTTHSDGIVLTPAGLNWVNEWGSLRHASGAAAVFAQYGRDLGGTRGAEMKVFAQRQISYILGATGRSFLTGFGCDAPRNVHHRDSALTLEESSGNCGIFTQNLPNANQIVGALVGGPTAEDGYVDERTNFRDNEVALDYNAAFIAGLVQSSL